MECCTQAANSGSSAAIKLAFSPADHTARNDGSPHMGEVCYEPWPLAHIEVSIIIKNTPGAPPGGEGGKGEHIGDFSIPRGGRDFFGGGERSSDSWR